MEYSKVLCILTIVITGTLSWCPPHTTIRTSPIRGLSQPRTLHQSCCQGRGTSCGCGRGLQCCPNTDIRFVCVADPCDPNPCGNGVCATDSAGRRRCFCAVGTRLDQQGTCRSDPCFRNPCGRGGRCRATGGDNYTCRCSGGQIFNGKTCIANRCGTLRCSGSRCVIRGGVAVCECSSGTRFDGRSCVPVDPCRIHSCGVGGHCLSFNGRAECRCRRGFVLDPSTQSCVADNPCNRVFCGRGTCSRSGTSAVCNCDTGFKFDSRSRTCVRLDDPCRGVNCGGGTCVVNRNLATCECNRGFIFDDRRRLCVFEPQTTTAGPPVTRRPTTRVAVTAELGGSCSRSSCVCDAGFIFDRSTVTCQVINPCQASTATDVTGRVSRGARSGCLRSLNFPQNYPHDRFDEIAIPTSGSSTLTFVIQDMQIQTSGRNTIGFVQNNCFNDFLFINGQLFCGSLDSVGAHRRITIDVRGRNEVVVGMATDETISSRGFLLKWTLS